MSDVDDATRRYDVRCNCGRTGLGWLGWAGLGWCCARCGGANRPPLAFASHRNHEDCGRLRGATAGTIEERATISYTLMHPQRGFAHRRSLSALLAALIQPDHG